MIQDQKTLDFIEKAQKTHRDRYDYNKVLFKNTTDKHMIKFQYIFIIYLL